MKMQIEKCKVRKIYKNRKQPTEVIQAKKKTKTFEKKEIKNQKKQQWTIKMNCK